jgi:UDP-N-acetylmuramoyl-tripeptide--D-alanyl-D-alanine ligase
MMNLSLTTIAHWLGADRSADFDAHTCHAISIDSRKIQPGALFIAISGEKFDGHDFVALAEKNGAIAAIVSRPVQTNLPTILVKDTRKALGEIAKRWREQWSIPVLAITGSCGKTSTKSMVAHILEGVGNVLVTQGTMNNDIGLPLTMLAMRQAHQYAVFELGANHLGEIAYLADIAKPNLSLITNAGDAHLEGFGSVEGVAREKSNIYLHLKSDGVALLNSDDAHAGFWETVIGNRRKITFAKGQAADFMAREIHLDEKGSAQFILVTPEGEVSVDLPLVGKHHVSNALAAAAACFAMGVSLMDIKKGLESVPPVPKRLVMHQTIHGAKILDDSYNANPLSLYAGLELLSHYKQKKILILGDMNELGSTAEESHRVAGRQAKALGIDALYAVGRLSRFAVEGFGEGAHHFENKQSLLTAVQSNLTKGTVVLVKGSRGAKMEEIVAALTEN